MARKYKFYIDGVDGLYWYERVSPDPDIPWKAFAQAVVDGIEYKSMALVTDECKRAYPRFIKEYFKSELKALIDKVHQDGSIEVGKK